MFYLKIKNGESYALTGEFRLLKSAVKMGIDLQKGVTPAPMFALYEDDAKVGEIMPSGTFFIKSSHVDHFL